MTEARKGKMTPTCAQRAVKKQEERSPFSPAGKIDKIGGLRKRSLLLEGLRLGQSQLSFKFGQTSEKCRENLARIGCSSKLLIEGASPPSNSNQVSHNPAEINPLVFPVRIQKCHERSDWQAPEKKDKTRNVGPIRVLVPGDQGRDGASQQLRQGGQPVKPEQPND
jgi:hypothetical protein